MVRSIGINSVYSLVCPHSLGTDACFASHGNMISTHGTKSCPHLLNIQTERCSYHHLQLSVKILKYCTLITMKRPELIDIKVFFLIKLLSEKPFWPHAIVSVWPHFGPPGYKFTLHYRDAMKPITALYLNNIKCHHNINMMRVYDCPWLLASNMLITRLNRLPSKWAYQGVQLFLSSSHRKRAVGCRQGSVVKK